MHQQQLFKFSRLRCFSRKTLHDFPASEPGKLYIKHALPQLWSADLVQCFFTSNVLPLEVLLLLRFTRPTLFCKCFEPSEGNKALIDYVSSLIVLQRASGVQSRSTRPCVWGFCCSVESLVWQLNIQLFLASDNDDNDIDFLLRLSIYQKMLSRENLALSALNDVDVEEADENYSS